MNVNNSRATDDESMNASMVARRTKYQRRQVQQETDPSEVLQEASVVQEHSRQNIQQTRAIFDKPEKNLKLEAQIAAEPAKTEREQKKDKAAEYGLIQESSSIYIDDSTQSMNTKRDEDFEASTTKS